MIRSYRQRGHLIAKLDPLGLVKSDYLDELHPESYGFKKEDYQKKIFLDGVINKEHSNISEILDFLKENFNHLADLVVSNPPYISKKDISSLMIDVKEYEPHNALTDKMDGLEFYRLFSNKFNNIIKDGGSLIVEVGNDNHPLKVKKLFEEAGIIEKLDIGDGRSRYEEAGEHHEHLIDVESGEIIEFQNEELEEMKRQVALNMGYELVDHRLELFGKKIRK